MSFTGKYETVTEENSEEFYKSIGRTVTGQYHTTSMTEIVQNGDDFTFKKMMFSDTFKWTWKFTVNKECEMVSPTGVEFKDTARMVGSRIIVDFPMYTYTVQVRGEELIEIYTSHDEDRVSSKRISKKIA